MRQPRPQEGANIVDRLGQRYGRLTVIGRAGSRGTAAAWLCRCDCGNTKVVTSNSLRAGNTKSCGCSRRTGPGSRPEYRCRHVPGGAARNNFVKQYRHGAKLRGVPWELSKEECLAVAILDCAYCGRPPSRTIKVSRNGSFVCNGLDRKDNERPYTVTNVVPCCSTCNHAKRDRSYEDFVAWLDQVAQHRSSSHSTYPGITAALSFGS